MKKKFTIQVRAYTGESRHTSTGFNPVETITRTLYAEQVGNFNPIFCRYKGRWYLVHSDEGDTSDPFRREEGYAKSFYIESGKPCERTTVSGHQSS